MTLRFRFFKKYYNCCAALKLPVPVPGSGNGSKVNFEFSPEKAAQLMQDDATC